VARRAIAAMDLAACMAVPERLAALWSMASFMATK
jgi:hypothetical protein